MTPELNQSMVFGQCPSCQQPFAVGLGQTQPVIQYVLRPVDLENKRKQLVSAIEESSMSTEQKVKALELYGNKNIMVDPAAADAMIQVLRTEFARIGTPAPEIEVKTSKKKKDVTQEPQTK